MLFHSLRQSTWLAKLALLWFVLTTGIAVASPILNPLHQTTLCSQNGDMVMVVLDDENRATYTGATLDCPLCFMGQATLPAQTLALDPQLPLGRMQPTMALARLAIALDLSPPSRGPPSFN